VPWVFVLKTAPFDECIRLGAERIGWKEKKKRKKDGLRRYGVGMALFMHVSGAIGSTQHRNVTLKFNEDGTVNLAAGSLDLGQNIHGALSQIAAEVLGVRYEDIIIHSGDTDTTLFDQGMHASGGLYQIGNAVVNGASELRRQLVERAAKIMEAPVDDLEVKEGRVYVKGSPASGISVGDVAREAMYNFEQDHDNLSAKGSFSPDDNQPPIGASFADVEVDVETGEVKVLKLVTVCDMGRAINPLTVDGQLEGGVAQGLGYALTEDFFIHPQTGILEADNYCTYKIPSVLDMPEIEVVRYEEPVSSGPFGAKGVGEAAMVPIAPAVANAVYDAVGVRITDLPITPEKVLEGLMALEH
jgi:xanthine dehydrogenase molybdenum-binding subunit